MTGFPTKPLSDQNLFVLVMGQSPPSTSYNAEKRGLPFFQGKSDFGLRFPVPRVWCDQPARIAEPMDVLISVRAPVGDANVAEHRACIGRGIAAVRARGDTDPDFLFYALLHLKPILASFGTGTTFESVNKSDVEALEIPFPDSCEQRAIAALLSKVQDSVEVEGELIRVTRELKQAALRQLFTRGLLSEAQKETEVGPVPESWEVVPLSRVCSFASGGTPSKSQSLNWGGDIPWVSPKDMKRPRLHDTIDHITQLGLETGSRLVPAGTILVVIRGMILLRDVPVALAMVPVAFNQDMKAILPGESLDSDFLLYAFEAFRSHLFCRVGTSAHGTRTLGSSALESFLIPVPNITEQVEIASILRTIDNKISFHQERHLVLRELFRTLLHDLMTGRRRVSEVETAACA